MTPNPPTGNIVLYTSPHGDVSLDVHLQDETVWLTQQQMATLYQTSQQNVSAHIRNIYDDDELPREVTHKKILSVQNEGSREVTRNLDHYNLDVILAVGYRVQSGIATRFRRWATQHLREFLIKGFVLNDERLKGEDRFARHFEELLARIRDIRASEARAYQRVREIFSMAVDYDASAQQSALFFAIMQNKMHYAATGHTAAEIVYLRADASRPHMGLTSWRGEEVRKVDVGTAKNYLHASEIDILNRIVVMFLDFAELRTMQRHNIHVADWERHLDQFLQNNELPVLDSAGSVSHIDAKMRAEEQYAAFNDSRRQEKEAKAEARYLDDLRQSAELLAKARNLTP